MPESTDKVVNPESIYDVIELIGTSTESWEDAAKNVMAGRTTSSPVARSGSRGEGHGSPVNAIG